MRALALTLATLVTLSSAAAPAAAQSFGRNKVQVERFDFRVLPTAHFDIYYYSTEHAAALDAARMAERWYERLSKELEHTLSERPPIVLYASHSHFTQTTVTPEFLSDGIGGFTDHARGRVVLPFTAGLGETDHVLGHELVHAFQRDILKKVGRSLAVLPLWFSEGMAEYLSVGRIDTNTGMWLSDAVHQDRLPTLEQLDDPKWFPYRYGQALWVYLSGVFGDDLAARSLRSKAKGGAIGRLVAETGVDAATLSRDWHLQLHREFGKRAAASPEGGVESVPVGAGKGSGRVNVAPVLSPDGSQLVFLSERDGYSIDVFLANATTGAVTRKLVSTAADPHFDSLQFLESAGAWDATGRRFAFAALQQGHPVLTILDMPGGAVRRERAFDDLDQMFSPTWSPDGRRIAFSAMRGGTSDLYEFDLERDVLRRLTSDAFADLQPAWSPDGRTIAFVTDRFTSSLADLTFGDYRLAIFDVETSTTRALPFIPGAKHIDPHWADESLYFIADANATSNVFRLDVPTGAIRQVTDVREGVSGLTALSPALSVSAQAGRMAFSQYRRGSYEIRVASTSAPTMAVANETDEGAGLPATDESRIAETPAPPLTMLESRPYRRNLSLRSLGQPYVAAGGGMIGGFFRAGTSLAFSDLLEDQQVLTAVQFGTSARDLAVQTSYVNRQSRWNWGVLGAQVPMTIGNSRLFAADVPGDASTITRETEVLRQVHRDVSGLLMYPFTAARRLELSAGIHAISFDRQFATQVYASTTGRLIREGEGGGPAGAPVTVFETSAALVYDSSVFGATGPVLGSRYRLEAAPTLGELSLLTLSADYRRYLMPVRPFTVAVRVEHVGRYGESAGDPRLLPLVWSLRDLVRGFDPRPVLTTAQLAVSNVELRVPIIGPFGRVSGSNVLPLDAVIFADAGAFRSASGSVTTLRSVGAGFRVNAGGFILEFDAVRPLDQLPRGWTMAVNFRPGF